MLISKLCNQDDFEQGWFREACAALKEPLPNYHRKLWEFCFIYQGLRERGMLMAGRRGLGFGVGREPLGSAFAAAGCAITLTDLDEQSAIRDGWVASNEHAAKLETLNERNICPPNQFRQLATFEFCDLNQIPSRYYGQFDFTWSSCVFEHCGSIDLGKQFILNQMSCLRRGGIAVHTTEYNLSSNHSTVESGGTVIYRRRDIEEMVQALRTAGYAVEIDFTPGRELIESYVDLPPYKLQPHLRLLLADYVCTSIGLIITKN